MPQRNSDRREEYVRATERILDKILTCTQMPLPVGINTDLEWQYFTEINDLVTELIQCQSKTGVEFGPPKKQVNKSKSIPLCDRLVKFKKWLHSNGVSKNMPIEFRDQLKEGIGAVASRNINKNEEIMRIPRSICMTTHSASDSPQLKSVLANNPRAMTGFLSMILHLISEKINVNSKWRPYLDCLPEIHALPIYFNPSDMSEFYTVRSSIVRDLANNLRDLVRAYANLFRIVDQQNLISIWSFTYVEFRWAAGTLFTRQNLIPGFCDSDVIKANQSSGSGVNSQQLPQRILALIPGWDMINHKEGLAITSTNNFGDGDQVFLAPEHVQEGDQVYMAYTEERTNRSRFIRTGFLAPHPVQNDSLSVSFKFPNINQVNRRKKVAYALFELTEPFRLDISIPLNKNYDNIIGTLICAFGTDQDLEMLEKLPAIPQDQDLKKDQKLALVNKNTEKIMDLYERKEIQCIDKILKYVETQAVIKLSKYDESISSEDVLCSEIDKSGRQYTDEKAELELTTMVQFRKNVIRYLELEKTYAEQVLAYVHSEQKK